MNRIEELFADAFEQSMDAKRATLHAILPAMAEAAQLMIGAYRSGGKAIFCGNGGSAADAQHLAAEFVGRYLLERRALPALALNTNSSAVTAIGNDYGYDRIFARQIEALSRSGDVIVGLSTSGNAANLVLAFECARRLGLQTIALTGRSGGRLRQLADVLLNVQSDATPRIQECHILIGHVLCEAVEGALASADSQKMP